MLRHTVPPCATSLLALLLRVEVRERAAQHVVLLVGQRLRDVALLNTRPILAGRSEKGPVSRPLASVC